ncbi:MAG: cyclic nucleotide-binding domain-containing protein [Candidatus Hydrogenedentota bacterium]
MYIIVYGGVKINKLIDGFNKKTLATFAHGQFFGEMSLVDGYPRSATALTTRESLLYKFSTENYKKVISVEPYTALSIALSLAGWISMRLRTANLEIATLENWRILHEQKGKW